jgi:hypothetical protein
VRYRFLLALVAIALAIPALAHEQSWPGRRLAKAWPEARLFVRVSRPLSPDQVARIGRVLGSPILTEDRTPVFYYAYEAPDKKKLLGMVLFLDAYGQNGKMEISLGVDPNGRIAKVNVWQHSEDRDLNSDALLHPLIGKTFFDFPSDVKTDAFPTALKRGLLITMESFGSDVEALQTEHHKAAAAKAPQ